MKSKRRALGRPLPPVKEVVISEQDIDTAIALWDSNVPEWAGLLDPKPKGTIPAPKFYRDEVTGVITRARDGHVVTDADRRAAMDLYTKAVRG